MQPRIHFALEVVTAAVLISCLISGCHSATESATETVQTPSQDVQSENGNPAGLENAVESAFQERVIIDNDMCSVALTDYDPNAPLGAGFQVVVKNRSANRLTLSASTIVNGWQCHGIWDEQQWGDYYLVAEQGETVQTFLYWTKDE